jgi:hypothetical protein
VEGDVGNASARASQQPPLSHWPDEGIDPALRVALLAPSLEPDVRATGPESDRLAGRCDVIACVAQASQRTGGGRDRPSPKQSPSRNRRAGRSVVSSGAWWRLNAATPIADRGLLNHASSRSVRVRGPFGDKREATDEVGRGLEGDVGRAGETLVGRL